MKIKEQKLEKPFEIKYLRDIDKGTSLSKTISIICICFSLLVVLVAMVLYKSAVFAQKPQPYIMDKNGEIRKIYDAYDDGSETIAKKGLIEKAHELFFELNPDEVAIKEKIVRSFYYGDFKPFYEFYNSQNYYNSIVQRNAVQFIKKDSIVFNGNDAIFYGKIKVIGQGKVFQEKKLITQFTVKPVDRTDNNLYGFYIENIKMIDNGLISSSGNAEISAVVK